MRLDKNKNDSFNSCSIRPDTCYRHYRAGWKLPVTWACSFTFCFVLVRRRFFVNTVVVRSLLFYLFLVINAFITFIGSLLCTGPPFCVWLPAGKLLSPAGGAGFLSRFEQAQGFPPGIQIRKPGYGNVEGQSAMPFDFEAVQRARHKAVGGGLV